MILGGENFKVQQHSNKGQSTLSVIFNGLALNGTPTTRPPTQLQKQQQTLLHKPRLNYF